MDPRYALFFIPLIYVLAPFLITGNFVILGGVTVLTFVSCALIFIIVSNLQIGGSSEVFASGAGANIGLSSEGGYSLFVVFFGGVLYLGAQLSTFFAPLFNLLLIVVKGILGLFAWITGGDSSALNNSLVSSLGLNQAGELGKVYPLGITINGISVFLALDALMGSLFILGMYFMLSSRGH